MTGPWLSFGVAPQREHSGVGGMMPSHTAGTTTGPPQSEHVPMV
jgi:hypothetical protein